MLYKEETRFILSSLDNFAVDLYIDRSARIHNHGYQTKPINQCRNEKTPLPLEMLICEGDRDFNTARGGSISKIFFFTMIVVPFS